MIKRDELLLGIKKSEKNAFELMCDAELLFDNNRYSRAFTLYQLANEELGKCSLIQNYILQNDNDNLNFFLKEFRDHKTKTSYSNGIEIMIYNFINKSNKKKLLEMTIYNSLRISKINDLKNYSLYTSFVKGEFKTPSEMISKEDVELHKFHAELRFNILKVINDVFIENSNALIAEYAKFNIEESVVKFFDEEKEIINLLNIEKILKNIK